MKQFLCMFAAALVMCACNDSNEVENDTVKVGIKFSGDVISSATTPESRADINVETTYYGVNIQCNESDFNYSVTGVFDSPENISVDLPKGHNYAFTCFAVKGIIERCYENGSAVFGPFPFHYYKLEDIGKFVNGNHLFYGFENQKVDASLGKTECLLTAAEESVNVDLKRVSMGVNFMINPPIEGKAVITATCFYGPSSACNYTLYEGTFDPAPSAIYNNFQLMAYNPNDAWEAAVQGSYEQMNSATGQYERLNDYFERVKVNLSWTHEDGTTETLELMDRKIVRNKTTDIIVNLKPVY